MTEKAGGENPFIIPDEGAQLTWLFHQGDIVTRAMGGVFPEQEDLALVHDLLDLGCGSGLWAIEVAQQYPEMQVVGVDINASLIKYVRSYAHVRKADKNLKFAVMDVLKPLDFPDESFDLVNERTLFSSLRPGNWPPLLEECKRVLRPGGILRLTELERSMTTSAAQERYWDIYSDALQRTGRSFSQDGKRIGIIPHLSRLLHEAGFQAIKARAHTTVVAPWSDDFTSWKHHASVVANLLQPFIVESGAATEEAFTQIRQQIDFDMLSDSYCEMPVFVTVWGQKA